MTLQARPASLAVNSETFARWGDEGQRLLDALAKQTNRPNEIRTLREFRRTEALEIGDLTAHQWLKFRKQFEESSEARVSLADIHQLMDLAGTRPRRPPGAAPIRAAIANFKGGAGKTSVSLHLSHYLALRGWRVLVVDADPQGTLSRLFGFLPEQVDSERTLSEVFNQLEAEHIPKLEPFETHIDGLHLIPASLEMIGADIRVAAAFQNQSPGTQNFYRLVDLALEKIEDAYDIILIDTAPAFSFAALNILWAANSLIVPIPPSMPDFSASIDFSTMVGDIISSVERRAGFPKVWNPAVVVHTRVDRSGASDGIRKMSRSVWTINQVEEVFPESRVFLHAYTRLRSIYEVTGSDVDSRSLRRAREAVDVFGARMVQHFKAAWAENLGTGGALEALHG